MTARTFWPVQFLRVETVLECDLYDICEDCLDMFVLMYGRLREVRAQLRINWSEDVSNVWSHMGGVSNWRLDVLLALRTQ